MSDLRTLSTKMADFDPKAKILSLEEIEAKLAQIKQNLPILILDTPAGDLEKSLQAGKAISATLRELLDFVTMTKLKAAKESSDGQ
jgi:hypothetical protein